MSEIQNAKKLVKLVADGINGGLQIAEDGKFDISDSAVLISVAQEILMSFPNFKVGFEEMKNADAEGIAALVGEAAADLKITNPKVSAIIEALIEMEPGVMKLIAAVKM